MIIQRRELILRLIIVLLSYIIFGILWQQYLEISLLWYGLIVGIPVGVILERIVDFYLV